MDGESQEPDFKSFPFQNNSQCSDEEPFNPIAHDLITVRKDGIPKYLKDASVGEMIRTLSRLNRRCSGGGFGNGDDTEELVVIRFEEEEAGDEAEVREAHDWSQLLPHFDCCCNENNFRDLVSKLRQGEPQCYSSVSKTSTSEEFGTIQCDKISYGLSFLQKRLILVHHFHNVNGTTKEMIRMVTCGMPLDSIGAILYKAFHLAEIPRSGSGIDAPILDTKPATRFPHPKSILCGMLLCFEEHCRKNLSAYQNLIKKTLENINEQRDRRMRKPKGLVIQSVKLGDAIIGLVDIRQKVQYLQSSITPLLDMQGLPTILHTSSDEDFVSGGLEGHISLQWCHQLEVVSASLAELERRCKQDLMKVENLQERVKAIISIVSVLQVEIENERNTEASDFQTKMLKRQDFIAVRTKRDNTVMKVIAVLTALFLPGTFIATVFSVPVFNWDQENPIGPHFKTYWLFTVPITAILVFGFSIWFLKMWFEDLQADKLRAIKEDPLDMELKGGSISTL